MAENLESTSLRGPNNSSFEVKVGEKVCFIDPRAFSGRERTIQAGMIKRTFDEIGETPYKVKEITDYRPGLIMLRVEGKKGETEITKEYFTK